MEMDGMAGKTMKSEFQTGGELPLPCNVSERALVRERRARTRRTSPNRRVTALRRQTWKWMAPDVRLPRTHMMEVDAVALE